ncbi:hypothetical protein HPULCUR_003944 [Helicostylum pulchrum]|uniref:Uncharacterized protein n=1 Tax=Helicostylum pulchrum TaxID=562976 RepID=A0ABP9XUR4_9FUNG
MLGLKDRKREVYSFYIEVKRPTQESKYQPEDNFTKLLKTVKSSYDRQLVLGIKDPVALGLLCEGFACSLFEMNLRADGIYMPVMIKSMTDSDKFVGFEAKYKGRNRAMNEDIKKWMKPSFNTEVRK